MAPSSGEQQQAPWAGSSKPKTSMPSASSATVTSFAVQALERTAEA